MKKSLIALAVLGSMVGAAAAQSSVTLFGIVDAGFRYSSSNGKHLKTLSTDGLQSSRLGFRGEEDLGGGLKAGFWLEAPLNPDNGTANTSKFWNRRSSVSLIGNFGEVRLGRYLTQQFNGYAEYDVFGTNGVGDLNKLQHALGSSAGTWPRADNIVGYFLPGNLGGLFGGAEVAAGEGTDSNKYTGVRLGYAAGPLNISGAVTTTKATGSDYKRNIVGGSYNFGVVKLLASVTQNKWAARKQSVVNVGAAVPVGSGTIRFSYTNLSANSSAEAITGDAKQFALGYVHDLSKRTALYTTYSRINNEGKAAYTLYGSNVIAVSAGKDTSGFEVGVRHSF